MTKINGEQFKCDECGCIEIVLVTDTTYKEVIESIDKNRMILGSCEHTGASSKVKHCECSGCGKRIEFLKGE